MIAIEIVGLTKHFTQKAKVIRAVDEVNLQVRKGELFGLVGPNRAGKTTLLKLLSTLILPTSGKASINGYDILREGEKVRASIGLVTGCEGLTFPCDASPLKFCSLQSQVLLLT